MRRRPTGLRRSAAAVLVMPLLLTGCSLFGDDVGDLQVAVKGDVGQRPDVSFPKDKPGDELAVKTLEKGKGAAARKGDLVVADYVGYRWSDGGYKLLANTYMAGQPGAFPVGQLVKGLDKALEGSRAGGRVAAKIPPKDGYGTKGDAQHQVGAGDSLVYVLDVRAVYPSTAGAQGREQPLNDPKLPKVQGAAGKAPTVTVPRVAAPKKLAMKVLVEGTGPEVRKGQLLALQYVGLFWRDGKVFDSSWSGGRPYATTIGTGQVVKGWDDGLLGRKVGSRVLLVVPPALGYGAKGLPQAGIKGDDTLVFVVDVLGAH
ncbi:FKBP-type peptidyl-prolyl cis-trans isomerase [Actinomadura rudentiformis]|uniref:Peptidyl-prolyl cis-trans isomerase n=1 Tax=Actinomadura rudentiformis TaxID=359158 RepID=A0A6H9YW25_9ACTN|nr:FKBP-type peptidyl-prolyl cis-trans isomerase [Actinomadura rudentiformis]KAB2348956.1 FKBP-type peptidyl-prolyl cis-trans isomerase [Actinomadura rudentiformis]